ncbi:alanine or glycine:cation symporter, AGCS family [Peptoclostridium litorale DSM 5388]|uniref:Amino acid carrier protein n=1 Tax=Peptoclostridium litorale DSM 5388 TaxID=1121324 RepID=A0A069RFG1_PEPLI|nr:sodium:alanine symporter family protein [Peptoclostridium litorale]KDR95746.1 amino acid carrier protein [Peptoclostridium litorale DSM 5388]SIO22143.1 alanine or glycine:cation symporter, AGCS family [Peptoclostridium litorale DSM 5388]
MNMLLEINDVINRIVWGPPMLVLLLGTGIYLSIRTRFLSIFKFGYILKNTLFKIFKKEQAGEGEITPFQALTTALASTVGTGNIAGVATAIALGGPGAIFWMWVSALFGMTTKFGEIVLSIMYREKTPDDRYLGGPMYYIEKGLGFKWLAVVFSLLGALAAFGIGNMVQANSVAAALETTFGANKLITGIILAITAGAVILGGIKRIALVTEKLVPIMATFYIIGALVVIFINISDFPDTISLIFSNAFTGTAAFGGFAGSTIATAMRFGVARGIFSNEAGLGSAPIAHATATTDHPVRQALWGIFEVFADTIVICSLTAFAVINSGAWKLIDPITNKMYTGAALTSKAFDMGIPVIGGYIVSVGILLFAFSTILGWAFYGERCAEFAFGTNIITFYRVAWILFIVVGAIGGLEIIWIVADTLNGLMAIPNLIGLLGLSGVVIKLTKEFFATKADN